MLLGAESYSFVKDTDEGAVWVEKQSFGRIGLAIRVMEILDYSIKVEKASKMQIDDGDDADLAEKHSIGNFGNYAEEDEIINLDSDDEVDVDFLEQQFDDDELDVGDLVPNDDGNLEKAKNNKSNSSKNALNCNKTWEYEDE
eukprot:GSA120T00026269001.1